MENARHQPHVLTARAAHLVGCRTCGRVWPLETQTCARCGAQIESRDAKSMQRVWAWLLAGLMFYIPANIYPMLLTKTLVDRTESTIIAGVFELMKHGNIGIALIVFVASIVIPVLKFITIAYLALAVQSRRPLKRHHLHVRLLELIEFIGRWSMIDVFVVAIMATLVQLGFVVTINPGQAAVAFALSVVFTMLSALSFDSRLIWDKLDAAPHD
ncbi:MAG: paraquat-inducible protein A [Deltaproteobacteria bacterium]